MTLTTRQCLHTLRMAKLIDYVNSLGTSVKVQEWNRLIDTQRVYVLTGKSKTLNSKHLDNCATDLYIVKDGAVVYDGEPYRILGVFWENLGGRWGGRFHDEKVLPNFDPSKEIGWDPYHFETDDA